MIYIEYSSYTNRTRACINITFLLDYGSIHLIYCYRVETINPKALKTKEDTSELEDLKKEIDRIKYVLFLYLIFTVKLHNNSEEVGQQPQDITGLSA